MSARIELHHARFACLKVMVSLRDHFFVDRFFSHRFREASRLSLNGSLNQKGNLWASLNLWEIIRPDDVRASPKKAGMISVITARIAV